MNTDRTRKPDLRLCEGPGGRKRNVETSKSGGRGKKRGGEKGKKRCGMNYSSGEFRPRWNRDAKPQVELGYEQDKSDRLAPPATASLTSMNARRAIDTA